MSGDTKDKKWVTVEVRRKWSFKDEDSGICAILSIRDSQQADFLGKKPGYVLMFQNALNDYIHIKNNQQSVYLGNNKKTEWKETVSLAQAQKSSLAILDDFLKTIVMPKQSQDKIDQ